MRNKLIDLFNTQKNEVKEFINYIHKVDSIIKANNSQVNEEAIKYYNNAFFGQMELEYDEMINFLSVTLSMKAEKAKERNIPYDPYVVHGYENLRNFLVYIANCIKDEKKFNKKIDIVIGLEGHFVPYTFRIANNKLYIVSFDASPKRKSHAYVEKEIKNLLSPSDFHKHLFNPKKDGNYFYIQTDMYSCYVYSYIYSWKMGSKDTQALLASINRSKKELVHLKDDSQPNIEYGLKDLGCEYVKYAQSLHTVNAYKEAYPNSSTSKKKAETLEEFSTKNSFKLPYHSYLDFDVKSQHRALDFKYLRICENALKFLSTLTDEQIEKMVAKRTEFTVNKAEFTNYRSFEKLQETAKASSPKSNERVLGEYTKEEEVRKVAKLSPNYMLK
jgi:hypothetical protein